MLRLESECLSKFRDRVVELAFPTERDRQVVVRRMIVCVRLDRLAEMGDCFVQFPLLEECAAQAVGSIRVVWPNSERLAKFRQTFIPRAALEERFPEIAPRFTVVRAERDHRAIALDRLGELLFLHERIGQVGEEIWISGAKPKRFTLMGNGLINSSELEQRRAEATLGDVVILGYIEDMSPESLGIGPIARLFPGETHRRQNEQHRSRAENRSSRPPRPGQIGDAPGEQQIDADLRQVSVAIGVRL